MKKFFCLILVSAILVTGCGCSSTPDDKTSTDNTNDTEVNATEYETTSDNTEEESTSIMLDDGTCLSIDALLSPMNSLNAICQGDSGSDSFDKVYPEAVISKLIEYNNFESTEIYADFLNTAYVQMYGDSFSIANEYISCLALDEQQLEDMREFYNEYFFTDIEPVYAFIVESEFCVTYTDEEGNELEDCSSDYFIAYCLDDVIYLDYFYVDTLDL